MSSPGNRHHRGGFTLVEMALVLTIVGLLIGGLLKGQQLLRNARVTSTITQIHTFEAAIMTFRGTYDAVPGDMLNANLKIPNCPNCIPTPSPFPTGPTAGDGMVGTDNWTIHGPQAISNLNGALPPSILGETILFWAELGQAGLLMGLTNDGLVGTGPVEFGKALPSARIGGGWYVGNSCGCSASVGRPSASSTYLARTPGTIIVLAADPIGNLGGDPADPTNVVAGKQVLLPMEAAQIDRKMDDGMPESGFAQAYGVTTSCYTSTTFGPYAYAERLNSKDCGLVFRIQE